MKKPKTDSPTTIVPWVTESPVEYVELTESMYARGALFRLDRGVPSEFLLNEGLRFFNYGTKDLVSKYVEKSHASINRSSFAWAVEEYGDNLAARIYHNLLGLFESKTLINFVDAARLTDPYVSCTVATTHQRGWLLAHMMSERGWTSTAGESKVLKLWELHTLWRDICQFFEQNNLHRDLLDIDAFTSRDKWIGGDFCAASGPDYASIMKSFTGAPSNLLDIVKQPGLTEKIYSILSVMEHIGLEELEDPFGSYVYGSLRVKLEYGRQYEQRLDAALAPLKVGPNELDRWLKAVDADIDLLMKYRTSTAKVPGSLLDTAITAITWGIYLLHYLRMFLLRTKILTIVAAFPFSQIFQGGKLQALGKTWRHHVKGIIGPLGVALWERFTAPGMSHFFQTSASQGTPPFSRYSSRHGDAIQLGKAITPDPKIDTVRSFRFDDNYRLDLAGEHWDQNTRDVCHCITTRNRAPRVRTTDDSPPVLSLLAARHYGYEIPEANTILRFQDKKKSSPKIPRKPFDRVAVPPLGRPPFKRNIEYNPQYLDNFFAVTKYMRLVLFDKARNFWFSDSAMIFSAKMTTHLQTYVTDWLLHQALSENKEELEGKGISELDHRLKFTCASIQWGGKNPPHDTHRDGYGYDFGLMAVPGKESKWVHFSTFWPLATQKGNTDKPNPDYNPKDKRSPATVKQTYAEELMNGKLTVSDETLALKKFLSVKGANARRAGEVKDALAKIFEGIPAEVTGNQDQLSNIPQECLIATVPGTKNRFYVYRELMRNEISKIFGEIDFPFKLFNAPNDKMESFFKTQEAYFKGMPVFEKYQSHVLHHFAHLAFVLAMPAEFVWGAPVYHLRALRAIFNTFRENKLEYNPFAVPRDSWLTAPERRQSLFPLPLPRIYFKPNDHFNHWHITYWSRSFPGRFHSARLMSRKIRTHLDFVKACLPLWHLMGVKFEPFKEYLDEYRRKLKSGRPGGKAGLESPQTPGQLENEIAEIEKAIDESKSKFEKERKDPVEPAELRKQLFQKLLSYVEPEAEYMKPGIAGTMVERHRDYAEKIMSRVEAYYQEKCSTKEAKKDMTPHVQEATQEPSTEAKEVDKKGIKEEIDKDDASENPVEPGFDPGAQEPDAIAS